jgi:5'-3' exonuclease
MSNIPKIYVDGSFFCFYRYGATSVWFSQHKKLGEDSDCHVDNPDFMEYYMSQFQSMVDKICKKFKSTDIYWFADTPQEELWRMPHHPSYKDGREEKANHFIGPIIGASYRDLIPKDRVIKVPKTEADDGIAIATQYERKKNSEQKIYIISGDSDLLQLCDENTIQINPKSNTTLSPMPIQIKIGKNRIDVAPDVYLRTKILMGDKTDEIPAVYSGCGPATAHQLAMDNDKFDKEIRNIPERYESYLKNKMLISLWEIPEDLGNALQSTYVKIVKEIEEKTPPIVEKPKTKLKLTSLDKALAKSKKDKEVSKDCEPELKPMPAKPVIKLEFRKV